MDSNPPGCCRGRRGALHDYGRCARRRIRSEMPSRESRRTRSSRWSTCSRVGSPDGLDGISASAHEARRAGFEGAGVTAFRDAATLAVRTMDYGRADRLLADGLLYADAIEQSHCRHVMGALSGLVSWASGDWANAATDGPPDDRRPWLPARGSDGALGGRVRGVRPSATTTRQKRSCWRPSRLEWRAARSISSSRLLWGLAEAALLADRPDQAAGSLPRCDRAGAYGGRAGSPGAVRRDRSPCPPGGRAAGRRGERGWRPAPSTSRRCRRWPSRPSIMPPGLVALASGATGVARQKLEAAVVGWDGMGRIWEGTWARLDLASCLTARTGSSKLPGRPWRPGPWRPGLTAARSRIERMLCRRWREGTSRSMNRGAR